MLFRPTLVAAVAILVAATLELGRCPSIARADIGLVAAVLGAGGLANSYGPYDDCPNGMYKNKKGVCVESPDSNRGGATGQCCDGADTHAQHRTGACSSHGGVCQWFAMARSAGTLLPQETHVAPGGANSDATRLA